MVPMLAPEVIFGASSAPTTLNVTVVGVLLPRLSVTVKLKTSVAVSPTCNGSSAALAR